jgi:hypothetical protein
MTKSHYAPYFIKAHLSNGSDLNRVILGVPEGKSFYVSLEYTVCRALLLNAPATLHALTTSLLCMLSAHEASERTGLRSWVQLQVWVLSHLYIVKPQ